MNSIPDIFKTLSSPGVCGWWCFEALMSVAHWLIIFSPFLRHDFLWEQLSCGWGQSSHTQSRNQPASHNTHITACLPMLPSNGAGSHQAAASLLVVWPGDRCSEEKNGTDLIFLCRIICYLFIIPVYSVCSWSGCSLLLWCEFHGFLRSGCSSQASAWPASLWLLQRWCLAGREACGFFRAESLPAALSSGRRWGMKAEREEDNPVQSHHSQHQPAPTNLNVTHQFPFPEMTNIN